MPGRAVLGVPAVALGALLLGTASGSAATSGGVHVVFRSEQKTPITYNQGVARIPDGDLVPGGWILSGTNKPLVGTDNITRMDDDLNVIDTLPTAIPPQWRARGYDHIGDIDIWHGLIYAPFEQPDYSKGEQVTATYDLDTLVFQKAWVVHQHENSFVTIDPKTSVAYSMQHSNGRYLTRNDAAHGWKHLPALRMSRRLFHTQGADVARGYVWISTSDEYNRLWRVNEKTGEVDYLGHHRHPGGEGEGLDATVLPRGDLHTQIRDAGTFDIYLEHWVVEPDPSPSGGGSSDSGSGTPAGGGSHSASGTAPGSSGTPTTGGRPVAAWFALALAVVAAATWRLRPRRT